MESNKTHIITTELDKLETCVNRIQSQLKTTDIPSNINIPSNRNTFSEELQNILNIKNFLVCYVNDRVCDKCKLIEKSIPCPF